MRISLTAADGTRLVARRTGRGTPVVLVHGSAGGLDSYDPIVPLLEDAYEVWVLARRGYPPSGGCRRPKTFADDLADVRTVLAAAGGSAHLVGASASSRSGSPGSRQRCWPLSTKPAARRRTPRRPWDACTTSRR